MKTRKDEVLEIWGTNSTLSTKVTPEVTSFDLHSNWRDKWAKVVRLSITELFKGTVPGQPTRTKENEVPKVIIVSARLLDADNAVSGPILELVSQSVVRVWAWNEPSTFRWPWVHVKFPPVEELGLKVTTGSDGESISLSTQKPIKGIILEVGGEEVRWNDQAIDLIPDDLQKKKIIQAVGLR